MAKNKLTDDDSILFRQMIGNVKTIEQDKVLLNPRTNVSSKKANKARSLQETFTKEKLLRAEDSLSFLASGLNKDVLKKLRRGYFGVDAELDLHGLTSHEAQRQLQCFLHDCIEEGCQCVHIIHGKGYRSKNNYPILKNNLNHW